MLKIFVLLIFVVVGYRRKFLNDETFPIYGTVTWQLRRVIMWTGAIPPPPPHRKFVSPLGILIHQHHYNESLCKRACPFLVGMVVFRLMSRVKTPPSVSIPRDSGVTSSRRTSVTSPAQGREEGSGRGTLARTCPRHAVQEDRICPSSLEPRPSSPRLYLAALEKNRGSKVWKYLWVYWKISPPPSLAKSYCKSKLFLKTEWLQDCVRRIMGLSRSESVFRFNNQGYHFLTKDTTHTHTHTHTCQYSSLYSCSNGHRLVRVHRATRSATKHPLHHLLYLGREEWITSGTLTI